MSELQHPTERAERLGASTLSDNAALTSIAISLKRIADVLDGSAIGLCVSETIFNPATVQNRDVRNNY